MARCSARLAHLLLLGPGRPSRLPFLSERESPGHLPGTRPSSVMRPRAHSPPSTRTVIDAVPHLRAPRPRRSRYVCEMWRPIFPSPEGPPSGIINSCATAAARRAGAGTLRTGYRGWSDRISAPSGTDALNHTNSKYERMCTEVLLDKVCPSGRPHHFLTKKLFSIEWIRSARSWPDGRLASNTYGDVSHPPLDGEFDPGSG